MPQLLKALKRWWQFHIDCIMKERQSVKFANWTKTREELYRKESNEILYRTKSEIIFENDFVFTVTNNHKTLLLTIDNPKTKWFQVWLKLRDEK
ncbi:hypothetical protein GCM10023229_09400 [Flavisolibacter ginsenosidimutans]